MFKEKVNRFIEEFGWSKLRALGHNSIIKSSYIWLIIVPLAAKMFSALPEQHTFKIFEANIIIHFGLPFSWVVFYFMALFFAIGQLIYSLKCPEILKNYANFSDYEKSGGKTALILKCLDERFRNNLSKNDLIMFRKNAGNLLIYNRQEHDHLLKTLNDCFQKIDTSNYDKNYINELAVTYKRYFTVSHNEYLSDWFYVISQSYEQVDFFWLKINVICFALGFLFFIIVAIQNLWFVLKAIF